ncbi:MAG: RNA 2',3'-cyclic phosphodiesterase [Firmicutes bacterium]|nr:RNA 2',3'-cyclic phosphodiesterase [Bacillota bacterium]
MKVRLFVACAISDGVRERVMRMVKILKPIRADIKWVETENLHLTVKFLDEIPEHRIPVLIEGLSEAVAGFKPFRAEFRGTGVFPNPKHPTVLWVGLEHGRDELRSLARRVEDSLEKRGFPRERKEYTAHLTVGRIRGTYNLTGLLTRAQDWHEAWFGYMIVDRLFLVKSTLFPMGPRYEPLASFLLDKEKDGPYISELGG